MTAVVLTIAVGGGLALLFIGLAIATMMRPRSRHVTMTIEESSEEE
jgi:hypothetical protein